MASANNLVLQDLEKIEFKHTHMASCMASGFGRAYYTEAAFHYKSNNVEHKKYVWKDVIEIAQQAQLNRQEYFLLDADNATALGVAVDKVVFNKLNDRHFEIIFNKPALHRLSLGLTGRWWANLLEMSICLILIMLIDSLQANIMPLTILFSAMLLWVFFFLWYKRKDYLKCFFSNHKAFPKHHDYPRITLTENHLVYEQYGKQQILPWENIRALHSEWRNTVLFDVDNARYPIPTYELISMFSSDALLSKIIEYAKLKQASPRSKLWINPKLEFDKTGITI